MAVFKINSQIYIIYIYYVPISIFIINLLHDVESILSIDTAILLSVKANDIRNF